MPNACATSSLQTLLRRSSVAVLFAFAVVACGSESKCDGSDCGSTAGTSGASTDAGAGGAERGGNGSGGASGGGAGADTGGTAPQCDPTRDVIGRIDTPNPLISVGAQVTSSGVQMAERAVDGSYGNGTASFGPVTAEAPSWIAIPVDRGPTRLLLVWADGGSSSAYNATFGAPADYRIETSADSTDGEDGTWQLSVSVEGNAVHARGHSIDFDGKAWVRFVATAVPEGNSSVALAEIALYDVSSAADERPQDTWAFLGDSITQGAFGRTFRAGTGFDAQVHALHPEYMPAMINGGIGGELASDGARRIAEFLELNPDFQFIAIGYGTNDSWGNAEPLSHSFEPRLRTIIEAVLEAGRVPILASIPFSDYQHATLGQFNEVIHRLTVEYELPCGPDLYTWFREHAAEDLSADRVHPSPSGYVSMNRLWAEAASALYVDP